MLSIQKLRTTLTKQEGLELVLEIITGLGFETTGWQDGRIQKTIVSAFGIALADFSELACQVCEFGFNEFASGEPLNLFSKSRFDNEKTRAISTAGPIRLTSTASTPYTLQPGQLIASTPDGVEFRNTTGGTLSAGSVGSPSTLQLQWQAVISGSQGNVGLNTINRLITPLAGVTVANDTGTPWYTTAGVDETSDESLRTQNRTKWSRLSVELIAEAYENIALNVLDSGAKFVSKVRVDDQNPRGAGTLDVYVAGDAAVLGNAQMQLVQEAFAARAWQTDDTWVADWTGNPTRVASKKPATSALNITATLYHDPGVSGSNITDAADEALEDFLAATPLGGWDYSPGPSNVVTVEDILEVLRNVEGVRTVVMSTPSSSVVVPAFALVTKGTWTLTPVAVTT